MIRRFAAPLVAAVGLLTVLAVPAAAHVKVSSDNAQQGGYSVLTFRVPNEESDADTVSLKVQFPTDHPIASVSVQPKPGWTFTTKTTKLAKPIKTDDGEIDEAVSEIDWTGGKIAPGEFDMFNVSAGPLPTDTDSLTFKAIQTYQDAAGKTSEVAWIEIAKPGQPEPEHPAPVLQLTPASGDAHASSPSASTTPSVTAADSTNGTSAASATKTKSSTSALTVFALAVGVAGLIMAIIALIVAAGARQKLSSRDPAKQ